MKEFTFSHRADGLNGDMYKEATAFLEKKAVPFAQSSIKELIRHFLKSEISALSFMNNGVIPATAEDVNALESGITRLSLGEPPQYITGSAPFYGYDFFVDSRVLVPRFDTEILVEKALECVKANDRVLDLCSGSGCIGIAVALNEDISLTALDVSRGAGEVFLKNCESLLCEKEFYKSNPPRFIPADLFDMDISEKIGNGEYDLILSNPPYIRDDERETLSSDVLKEPEEALFGGKDGLDFYRRIIPLGKSLLKDGGYLFLECGKGQSRSIMNIMRESGYQNPLTVFDYGGIDRVVYGVNRK